MYPTYRLLIFYFIFILVFQISVNFLAQLTVFNQSMVLTSSLEIRSTQRSCTTSTLEFGVLRVPLY